MALRVLVADDYADSAASLAMLLFSAGIEIEIAMDGEEALARASAWQPDVCVLDLTMPRLGGLEIARRIREQSWSQRPLLIALTGWTSPESRRSAFDAGFDHYIMKPVEPLQLMSLIESRRIGVLR